MPSSPRDTRGTDLGELEQASQASQVNSHQRTPRPLNPPSSSLWNSKLFLIELQCQLTVSSRSYKKKIRDYGSGLSKITGTFVTSLGLLVSAICWVGQKVRSALWTNPSTFFGQPSIFLSNHHILGGKGDVGFSY